MATWNTAFNAYPAGTLAPNVLDDSIRETRTAVYERLVKEHMMDLSSGLVAADGWHRAGAAHAYSQSAAPTNRPDDATALTSADYGRLWHDSDDDTINVYTDSGWRIPALSSTVGSIASSVRNIGNITSNGSTNYILSSEPAVGTLIFARAYGSIAANISAVLAVYSSGTYRVISAEQGLSVGSGDMDLRTNDGNYTYIKVNSAAESGAIAGISNSTSGVVQYFAIEIIAIRTA